ncbi:hypothetical protein WH47_06926 [Habropoda laboriosa]|uniref:Uncharacterized protein n=1 Tax=Habropoda laboriosa TaxID=597456 RepID=A0A0L7QQ74_9HYME|nr:hypothetical protein WH47_06926 [Habropoda laboriosa]
MSTMSKPTRESTKEARRGNTPTTNIVSTGAETPPTFLTLDSSTSRGFREPPATEVNTNKLKTTRQHAGKVENPYKTILKTRKRSVSLSDFTKPARPTTTENKAEIKLGMDMEYTPNIPTSNPYQTLNQCFINQSEELLERFVDSFTQNNNESYSMAACIFNDVSAALLQMLEAMEVHSDLNAHQYVTKATDAMQNIALERQKCFVDSIKSVFWKQHLQQKTYYMGLE